MEIGKYPKRREPKWCGSDKPHIGHVWTDEYLVQDFAASLEAEEPVIREAYIDEWCGGHSGPGSDLDLEAMW